MNESHDLINIIPHPLAQYLDAEAIKLRSLMRPELEEDLYAVSQNYFQSTLLVGAMHIEGREHPLHFVKSILSLEGQETARYFPQDEIEVKWIGFSGESFDAFLKLCRQLHDVPEVAEVISFTFLVEAGFEWFRRMHNESEIPLTFGFTTAVLSICEPEINSVEIWIPVKGMEFSDTFSIGKVKFKCVSAQDLQNWLNQWGKRWPSQEHPHRALVDGFFFNVNAQIAEPLTVAVVQLRAEPIRAVEKALNEIERTIGIIRFFSRQNFYPFGVSHCAIEGTLPVAEPRYILLDGKGLTSTGRVGQMRSSRPLEKFGYFELSQMRESGLSVLHRLLQLESSQRSPFEKQLLKSLEIYAKASLTRNVSDKLLYIVVALESMFIQGNEGSLSKRVAERIAFLLGQSLYQRHAIIDAYKAAYSARSDAVHRGDEPEDREMLMEFLNLAWHVFKHLIENSKKYQSKIELLEELDEMKFR